MQWVTNAGLVCVSRPRLKQELAEALELPTTEVRAQLTLTARRGFWNPDCASNPWRTGVAACTCASLCLALGARTTLRLELKTTQDAPGRGRCVDVRGGIQTRARIPWTLPGRRGRGGRDRPGREGGRRHPRPRGPRIFHSGLRCACGLQLARSFLRLLWGSSTALYVCLGCFCEGGLRSVSSMSCVFH